MRGILLLMFFAVAALAAPMQRAAAATTVQVVETDPAGDEVVLGHNRNFYLHLRYSTDAPVKIWAHPYFQGKPAKAGSNPSRTYSGEGEALGWFFLFDAGAEVDEVRINAGDGSLQNTPVVATYAVHVTGSSEPGAASVDPEWVTRLNALDKAAQREAYEKRMNTASSPGSAALFGGFMLAMLALGLLGTAWPLWALWRWRGGWRMAALVPFALMAFVIARLVIDTARDPTSHNLWPFEIVMFGGVCCIVMLSLVVARKGVAARGA